MWNTASLVFCIGIILGKTDYNQTQYSYAAAFDGEWNESNPVVSPTNAIQIFKYENNTVYINNTRITTGSIGSANSSLYLFAVRNIERTIAKMRMYECKIFKAGVMVRHFIPVRRRSDDTICLYDEISQTFFTNQGTGTFIAGPEIN